MRIRTPLLAAAMALATLAAFPAAAGPRNVTDADRPRALPEQGPVSVRWTDPARFTELRYSPNRWEARQGNWVADLAEYLRASTARRLPAGERLDIEITDIQRAGSYEPWRGFDFDRVRIVRDLYPPRMTLQLRRTDANGAVIAEGERKLSDVGFLMGSTSALDDDPLRYEKHMIDRWAQREIGPRLGAAQ